jgi:putative thioredoxin
MDHILGRSPFSAKPGAAPATADGAIKDATIETFAADVLDASMQTPVIVDFWAEWCGPCKQLTPVLERVVRESKGKVRLVKINIDKEPEIARQMRIQSIPAVYAFKNGQPVDGFMGALPESQVKQFVARLIAGGGPSPIDELIAEGEQALAARDVGMAAQIFAAALQQEQGHPAALAGLARCYIASGDLNRAQQTLALVAPDAQAHEKVAAARADLKLAEQAATAGDVAEFEAKLAADPKNHQARYDLAMALHARGDREGAVRELLEIVRRDRNWNEQAARQQLLTLFEAFGPADPLTLSGRRQLSSILFS